MTVGAVALFVLLRRQIDHPIAVGATIARTLATATAAGLAALAVAHLLAGDGRIMSAAALVGGAAVGGVVAVGGQAVLGAPELAGIRRSLKGRPAS
jgi:hypothetical protein